MTSIAVQNFSHCRSFCGMLCNEYKLFIQKA